MQPQTSNTQQTSLFKQLFSGWLAKALTLSLVVSLIMISFAFGGDLYFQELLAKRTKAKPSQVLSPFISPSPIVVNISETPDTPPIDTLTLTHIPNATETPTPKVAATRAQGNTITATPTHNVQATNTPTNPPQNTNTNSPSPTQAQIAGCFVTVSGYLYNMQPGIGSNAIDPNTGKSHSHTSNDYHCGTQSAPTDMTAVYMEKHLAMGCAARLAPYIVTSPAPEDPSCQ